jgi:ABC-2 type transport system permease protein
MTPKAGSVLWLVAHDLTLNWRRFRDMFGRLTPAAMLAVCLAGGIVLHLLAWPIVVWLKIESGRGGLPTIAIPIFCILAWMSAQGLLGTARALQERGAMDLLLASPLPVRLVLASRLAATAASSFGSVALLVLPAANMGALVVSPTWLAAYPTLLALALVGTVVGMAIAIGLFLCCDPRRARLIAQLSAAFLGGAFLLAMQIAAMLPAGTRAAVTNYVSGSAVVALLEPVVAAAHGDWASLAGFTAFALALFVAAIILLSPSFQRASLRAAGAPSETAGSRAANRSRRFGSGLAPTLRRKEWRLLWRDHSVFAQLSLQIIYTVPLTVVLMRSVENFPLATALAPTIVVIAAQIAASLAWIAVSGEDAPELIAAAPVGRAEVELAKLTAIGAPILVILALPLVGLALLAPSVALLAAAFAAAASISTALLNLWHPQPGNRRGMLHRHSQSKLMALLEHLLALLWAVAIVVAIMGSAWVLLPIALVLALLASCRPAAVKAPA